MPCREPCQGRDTAALSGFRRVPRGCFEVATCTDTVSAYLVNRNAQYLNITQPFLRLRFFLYGFLKRQSVAVNILLLPAHTNVNN